MDDDVFAYNMGAKTAGLASFIFVSRIVSMIIAGMALILVARILGPSIYGVYTIAFAVASLFGMSGDFGIGSAFSKFIAEYQSTGKTKKIDELISNGLAASLILGVILTGAAFVLSGVLSALVLHSTSYAYVLQLASFMVVLFMIASVLSNALVGFGKGGHFALMLIIEAVVQSISSVALAVAGYGAIAPIIGLILGGVTEVAYALYVIFAINRVKLVKPSIEAIRSIFKFSLPIAATTAMTILISSLSLIVLGAFATVSVVGNVGIASKIGTFIGAFAESIGLSLLPAFASTLATKQKKDRLGRFYNYSVHMSLILVVPVLLSIALLSKQFTYTAFSSEYALAPLYVSVVSIGVIINIISVYTSTLLIGSNRVKELLKNYVVLTLVQLVAMAVLVPTFNSIGLIVLMFIVTPVTSVLLFARESGLTLKVKLDLGQPLRIILAGIISVAIFIPVMMAFSAHYTELLAGIAIEQLIVYPPVLAMLKGVTMKDLDVLKRITGHIPVVGWTIALLANYSARFARA